MSQDFRSVLPFVLAMLSLEFVKKNLLQCTKVGNNSQPYENLSLTSLWLDGF